MTITRRHFVGAALSSLSVPSLVLAKPQTSTIVIGQTVPWNGQLGEMGQDMYWGAKACFEEANASGVLNGVSLDLSMLDDSSLPHWAKTNVGKLINNYGAVAVMGCVGADVATAAAEAAKPSGTPLWGTFSHAEVGGFRFRASVQREVSELAKANIQHMSQVAVLHYDDEFGKQDLAQAKAAITALVPGCKMIAKGIQRNFQLANNHVQALIESKAQSYLFMVNAAHCGQAAQLLRSAGIQLGHNARLLATSEAGGNQLIAAMGSKGEGTVVSVCVPSYMDTKRSIVRRYQTAMSKVKEGRQSFASFESYLYAAALVEVLKTTKNPNAASIASAAQKMPRISFNDYTLTMDSSQAYVDIAVISSGRFRT